MVFNTFLLWVVHINMNLFNLFSKRKHWSALHYIKFYILSLKRLFERHIQRLMMSLQHHKECNMLLPSSGGKDLLICLTIKMSFKYNTVLQVLILNMLFKQQSLPRRSTIKGNTSVMEARLRSCSDCIPVLYSWIHARSCLPTAPLYRTLCTCHKAIRMVYNLSIVDPR